MSEKGIKGTSLTTAAIRVHVPIYCPEAVMMLIIIIRIRAGTHGDEWEQQQRQLKSGIKNSGGGKGLGPTFSKCGDEEGGLSNSAWSQFDGCATTTLGNGDDDMLTMIILIITTMRGSISYKYLQHREQ